MKTPNPTLLKFDCYIDHSIKNEFYHILSGMNFLDQYTNYEIGPTQITLVNQYTTIILERL